jgi:PAS domain S-box-containing protein
MPSDPSLFALEVAREFVSRAPVHMCLLDLDAQILEMSPPFVAAFVETSGFSRERLIGQDAMRNYPQAGATAGAMLARLRAGESAVEFEEEHRPARGRRFWLRTHASYWRDEDGAPVAILTILSDVTKEMAARAGRDEREAQLRAVIENAPMQIAVQDAATGRITLMNAALSEGLARVSGAAQGACVEHLAANSKQRADQLIAAAQAAGGCIEYEWQAQHGAFAGRSYRSRAVLFDDRSGRTQLLWTAEDNTELRSNAERLKQAAAAAEAANRAKSEFLANMSHEIRTPLNGVMGVAGALAKTPLSGPQQEMVSLVETSAKTLETLLSDILDLARVESGKMELKPEPFDLATSVGACSALFAAAARSKGLDLAVAIAPDALGAYVGDAGRLRQILCNLLSNAVKFTQEGGVRLTVSAHHGETSSAVRFEVRDTGIGFDPATKARLFSHFEQADGSITRRFGGSGLGLSISRTMAEAMGGRLEADAAPGEGAVFALTLQLPRSEGAPDRSGEAAPEQPAAAPLAGMKVLLAEDHPTNRRVVQLILDAAGIDLTCVENGIEAVAAFRARPFDLILMDMQMPLLDGLAAVQEIRRLERESSLRPTPIQMLTANAMPEHVAASLQAGADGHLSKPILPAALLERLVAAVPAAPGRVAAR